MHLPRLVTERCTRERNMADRDAHGSGRSLPSAGERVARPNEVDYALVQNMGEGFRRGSIKVDALGTTIDMVYAEWIPAEVEGPIKECPVVVCVHGTPATEGAFRPIGSLIASRGYRVLAVNFPGMGYTATDKSGHYDYSIGHKATLVKAFISSLQLKRVEMVIGHSTGSQVVACLGADPEMEGIVQSVCFLCGTGIRSYRAQESAMMIPYLPFLLFKAIYLPLIGWILQYLVAKLVHSFGFRGRTPESQVLSIYEASKLRFDLYAKDISKMADRQLPVLVLYTQDDETIEASSSVEVVAALRIPEHNCKSYDKEDHSEYTYSDGVLRRAVCFATGTHRLQFKKPHQTTQEIVSLLQALQSS